ncbi:MAG TPA: histidinol dehydrogenase, partial [Spirochaetia bacterium]|nr:histidinol dehydrogenase [Spirochaetia bacterium]
MAWKHGQRFRPFSFMNHPYPKYSLRLSKNKIVRTGERNVIFMIWKLKFCGSYGMLMSLITQYDWRALPVNLYYYSNAEPALQKILNRSFNLDPRIQRRVKRIIQTVKEGGDAALVRYARKFDRVKLSPADLEVQPEFLERCLEKIDHAQLQLIKEAADNIRKFHKEQVQTSWQKNFGDGVVLGQRVTPLDRVGVYVPGGKAFYPSTLLMNVIPAQLAGVREIVVITPPAGFYKNPLLGAVLSLLKVKQVYLSGGAQAVAALAFGTETVPKVDKITGPGNIYVSLAKREVFGYVDIDMIAGPSEVLVLADAHADPEWVALDLLSQAEHRTGFEAAILVTDSQAFAEKVGIHLYEHLKSSPHREIIEATLDRFGALIVVDDLEQGVAVVNKIAPEHLEVIVREPERLLKNIRHAGAVFVGKYSSEPVGDYWAGPNHVLPTGGTARFFSPLGVYDFYKKSSLIVYSKEAVLRHGPK